MSVAWRSLRRDANNLGSLVARRKIRWINRVGRAIGIRGEEAICLSARRLNVIEWLEQRRIKRQRLFASRLPIRPTIQSAIGQVSSTSMQTRPKLFGESNGLSLNGVLERTACSDVLRRSH